MMEAGPDGFSLVAALAIVIMLCGTTAMLTLVVKHPEGQGPQFLAPAYKLTMASTGVMVVRPPQDDPVEVGRAEGRGKSVSGSEVLGGHRIIKKKKEN